MKVSERNEVDPELNSFLTRVEELDARRSVKNSHTKNKTSISKPYTDDDLRKAGDLLNGTYENKDSYEMKENVPVTSLTFGSAYNYDKTFSPRKSSARDEQNEIKKWTEINTSSSSFDSEATRVSKFDDIYSSSSNEKDIYVVSREDYYLLQKIKKGMNVDSANQLLPSRGKARELESSSRIDFTPTKNSAASSVREDIVNKTLSQIKDKKPPVLPKRPSLSSLSIPTSMAQASSAKQGLQGIKRKENVENLKKAARKSPPVFPKKTEDLEKVTRFNIIDEPTDDISQRSILSDSNKRHPDIKNNHPLQPPKLSDISCTVSHSITKSLPSSISNDADGGNGGKPEAVLQREKLAKPPLPEKRRNITPEAIRVRTGLTRPVVPPKPRIDIPEAILRRSALNKPTVPPKPQIEIPEALLKRNHLNKTLSKINSTSDPMRSSDTPHFQATLENKLRARNLDNTKTSEETGMNSIVSNPEASSYVIAKGVSSLNKKRDRGPKRKLPSSVSTINK